MHIDTATLHDLEIVPTSTARGMSVWNLIDRTKTRVGSEALRERVRTPAASGADILDLQLAHRLVTASGNAFRHTLDRMALDDVEQFLNTKWQMPSQMPSMAWLRPWHPQYRDDVKRGRQCVRQLVDGVAELRPVLERSDSTVLRHLGIEIAQLADTPEYQELRRLVTVESRSARLQFDQHARSDAKVCLSKLLRVLGRLEAIWSIGAATAEHGWTYPRPAARWSVDRLIHPFLVRAAIPSSITLDEQVRVCFVTGPNMAGKSTFLKALAVATFLAHIGAGVPAAAMEFVPVDTLFSSIQVADSLSAGESFYLAEVRRIGALATALSAGAASLAVIDEPFRGTNVHDASEATLAIVTRLAAHPAAVVFVASHLAEIVPAIDGDPRIRFFNFAADVSGERPAFDYRLREGVSAQRLGMTLLRQEGVLERLERASLHERAIPPAILAQS